MCVRVLLYSVHTTQHIYIPVYEPECGVYAYPCEQKACDNAYIDISLHVRLHISIIPIDSVKNSFVQFQTGIWRKQITL